jgi:hypothetical protein
VDSREGFLPPHESVSEEFVSAVAMWLFDQMRRHNRECGLDEGVAREVAGIAVYGKDYTEKEQRP